MHDAFKVEKANTELISCHDDDIFVCDETESDDGDLEPIENACDLGGQVRWMGCAVHLIELVVNDCFKEGQGYGLFNKSLAKCRKTAVLGHKSSIFAARLESRLFVPTEVR